jgi:hypothetical protein
MTRMETRADMLARKPPRTWIPLEEPTLSNLDRLDRGMPPEHFGEPMKRNRQPSAAPFWVGLVVIIILLVGAVVLGVIGGSL